MSSAKSAASPEVEKARKAGGHRARPAAIEDDLDLLDMFLGDMRDQQDFWKPTAYWLDYCDRITVEIRRSGLKDFRRNWNLIKGYGNTPVVERFEPFESPLARRLYRSVRRVPPFRQLEARDDKSIKAHERQLVAAAANQASLLHALLSEGEHSRAILEKTFETRVGNPVLFDIAGKRYSPNLLRRINAFALLVQSAPQASLRRVIEIGGGYGVMPEILMRHLDGDIDYFVAVDIPPIVHIQTQYLKAVFPGRVADYREFRDHTKIGSADIAGRILVVPPWMLPRLDLDYQLFYNSASFQEMEPDIVANYLDTLSERSERIFITSLTDGHKAGARGQKSRISFDWLAGELAARGFARKAMPAQTAEARAFAADLPNYSYGNFERG